MDDRYQFQPWYIKAMRWLRWKPVFAFVACWWIARWLLSGAKIDPADMDWYTRGSWIGHLWTCEMSMADYRMGHYHSLDEVIAELRETA